ncbi:hypothetical protein [Steroidobacter cummioxidans]|uniref:hypothetical protein n=1 Tax=Steroidobacter cummioxidans TaxID=1803913 RepID=UPI000E31CDEC|nr:hypothetical protein [Steroidobacter cummioxidans]
MSALDAEDIDALIALLNQPDGAETVAQFRRQLNAIRATLEQIESYIDVANSVLRAQAAELDVAVATVLEGTSNLLATAHESLDTAHSLLPRISLQPSLAPELVILRHKLSTLQGGAA